MIEASTQENYMKHYRQHLYFAKRTLNWTQIALDALSVVVVGGVLSALALAYFDVLVK